MPCFRGPYLNRLCAKERVSVSSSLWSDADDVGDDLFGVKRLKSPSLNIIPEFKLQASLNHNEAQNDQVVLERI